MRRTGSDSSIGSRLHRNERADGCFQKHPDQDRGGLVTALPPGFRLLWTAPRRRFASPPRARCWSAAISIDARVMSYWRQEAGTTVYLARLGVVTSAVIVVALAAERVPFAVHVEDSSVPFFSAKTRNIQPNGAMMSRASHVSSAPMHSLGSGNHSRARACTWFWKESRPRTREAHEP